MKKIIITAIAVGGLALSASAAFAHGHLVTGPELYATPTDNQAATQAPQTDRAPAHKTRVIRRATPAPRTNGAS